ncbi:hypothetical protein BDM02DRAFT_3104939 [Thelephora ganbajun]|uniref:Uncharacterized protein n=1 Tax=Thelephora ganbajun TaxID=370292 RepID=A0ACB6Z052_THEGA|nr:hypothetical protein BDM02DRAFT_3104939 [Thelephora ganbajun]
MQTAGYHITNQVSQLPAPQSQQPSVEAIRASVAQLLFQARNLPCSKAAQAFTQLLPCISRFQLALDALLPSLDEGNETADRILSCYILYSMYAPHPISINPFATVLHAIFVRETNKALEMERDGSLTENDQFVYVLWKILKGDGRDIGPFSPQHILKHPIPTELRAVVLVKDANTRSWQFNLYAGEDLATEDGSITNLANGLGVSSAELTSRPKITPDEDREMVETSRGTSLLLAARERVLSLSEQRVLKPIFSKLVNPPVVAFQDILPIITKNPSIATPLLISLLTSPSPSSFHVQSMCFDALIRLPPTLNSFDVIGSLLRDKTPMTLGTTGVPTTVGEAIKLETLGYFLHECISWLDTAEIEERQGLVSEDIFAKGVQNLCRFYYSLIKLSILGPAAPDGIDTIEMVHFTLRNSRFEDATALYRILVTGSF